MDNRDNIDFGRMHIPRLFIKLFIPTLLGLVFNAMLTLADGIFVGQGIGSNALAAVNIAAPIFLIVLGVSLMFATGVSVVAAVHLSRGNNKAANINATQALTVPFVVMALVGVLIAVFAPQLCYLFGGSQMLEPLVVEYLTYISPIPALTVLVHVGGFIIRLDGSPKYAMYVSVIPAMLNIFLDWLFVFPLNLGLMGAASATTISEAVGAIMALAYLLYFPNTLRLYKPKFSCTSLRLTMRNLGYMMKLGFPTFIAEMAISVLMIVGNFMFMSFLREDGVAAFSVACYLFPLVFMFGNSMVRRLTNVCVARFVYRLCSRPSAVWPSAFWACWPFVHLFQCFSLLAHVPSIFVSKVSRCLPPALCFSRSTWLLLVFTRA